MYEVEVSPANVFESKATPFFKTIIDFNPPGAEIVAVSVTLAPGIPESAAPAETVGAGKTSSSFLQAVKANAIVSISIKAFVIFVCINFIVF